MNRISLFCLLFGLVITFGCNGQSEAKQAEATKTTGSITSQTTLGTPGKYTITGKLDNLKGGVVRLQKTALVQQRNAQSDIIATAVIDSIGQFTIEGDINEQCLALLFFDYQNYAYIVLDGKDYEITGNYAQLDKITVKGSKATTHFRKHLPVIQQFASSIQSRQNMVTQYQQMKKPVSEIHSQEKKLVAAQKNFDGYLKNLYDTTSVPLVQYFVLAAMNPALHYSYISEKANLLAQEYPSAAFNRSLSNMLRPYAAWIGKTAPEIALNNPSGELMKLSDLKGKYVLLDFWASWCGPCRKENPHVVSLYNKYKAKGFTVFSVSLDRNKDSWIKAIAADKLSWPNHVSDLMHWKSAPAKTYGVNGIPATFLIDKEGTVIAKNLRGAMLEMKISELLGE